jgi:hypothetical protein
MHIKNKRGQSTVEYVLLMTAVVAVIILFVANQNKGGFQDQLNSTLNGAVQEMSSMSDKFSGSHASQPAPTSSDTPPYSVNVDAGV